jgi:hypothetical protein
MTENNEPTQDQEQIEISLVRLFIAAIETNQVLKINANDYMSDKINNKQLKVDIDSENGQFIVTLHDKQEVESDESGSVSETSSPDSEE